MMDTEQRFVFDKLDFCRIAGEQRELNGRKSWPDDPEGGLVLRIVDDCFDYELKLLPRIVSDSITPPAPRPVLPRTRASPPGDWYRGPSAFLRWSGSTILTSKTPGTDWHPKQSAGGMQFLCVAHTCDYSSGDRLPPDRSASIPSSPLHLGDGRWEITLAAHTLYLRKRMGASVGLTEGCASVLLPGGDGDCHVWDDGALNIPFTTPARTVVTGGEPYISSVHLWLRFLPVRDVLRLSQLNMSWRDGMPLILSVRDDLLYLWERANSPLVATWSSSQVLSQLHKIVDEILDELSGDTFENTSIASDVCSDGCSSEDGDEAHWRRLYELDAATLFGPGYDFDDLTHGGSLPQVKRPGYASRHGRGRRSLAREEESGDDDSLFDEQEGELHHYAARLAGGP